MRMQTKQFRTFEEHFHQIFLIQMTYQLTYNNSNKITITIEKKNHRQVHAFARFIIDRFAFQSTIIYCARKVMTMENDS